MYSPRCAPRFTLNNRSNQVANLIFPHMPKSCKTAAARSTDFLIIRSKTPKNLYKAWRRHQMEIMKILTSFGSRANRPSPRWQKERPSVLPSVAKNDYFQTKLTSKAPSPANCSTSLRTHLSALSRIASNHHEKQRPGPVTARNWIPAKS